MRNFGLLIAIAAAGLAATPALAGEAKLTWSDLDLTTEAGKAELSHRIDLAAERICAPKSSTGTLLAQRGTSASCLNEARAAISAKVAARTGNRQLAAGGGSPAEAR